MPVIDRRRLLATCGGAAAAAVAGCLDGVLDSSDGESADAGTVPGGARWLPAPTAFDRKAYAAFSVDVAAFYELRESLPSALTDELAGLTSFPGIDRQEQIGSVHLVGNRASVVTGEFGRDAVIDQYGEGFERVGTREGFTLLEGTLGVVRSSRAFAVRDGAMVAATPASSDDDRPLRPVAEAVVDAEAGAGDRYHEVSDSFRWLLETLPAGDTFGGAAFPPGETTGGIRANGTASTVGSATTDLDAVVRFEAGELEEDRSLADAANSSEFFRGADVETTTDDGTFRASASVSTDQLESLPVGLL